MEKERLHARCQIVSLRYMSEAGEQPESKRVCGSWASQPVEIR
jgi:hypothetical protein